MEERNLLNDVSQSSMMTEEQNQPKDIYGSK